MNQFEISPEDDPGGENNMSNRILIAVSRSAQRHKSLIFSFLSDRFRVSISPMQTESEKYPCTALMRRETMSAVRTSQPTLMLIVGLAFCSAAFSQSPTITLSQRGGPPTTQFQVSGSGFSPSAAVDIYFDITDQALAIANGSGSFSGIVLEAPAAALPGTHWVTIVQRSSDTGAQATFTVFANWSEFGFGPKHQGYNPYENVLNTSNVGGIDLLWRFPTSAAWCCGVASSPAVVNGVVYIGSVDNSIYALNGRTGAQLWSYATGGTITASPTVANGVVYVGSNDNNLYALNASTGAPLWSYTTGGGVDSSPTVANGVVYVGSYDDNVYALNASTGALLWSYTTGGYVYSSPAVANGVVYVGSNDANVYALNAITGVKQWSHTTGYGVNGSPTVAYGGVYICSGDDNVYALNASTGLQLWSYNTGFYEDSSPAVANGVVYVAASAGNVYALNAGNGQLLWSYPIGFYGDSTPAVANGVLYVSSDSDSLYALNASTGVLLWSYPTGGGVYSSPAVANGVVYVGSDDGNVYAFAQSYGMGPEQPSGPPALKTLRPNYGLRPSQPSPLPSNGDN